MRGAVTLGCPAEPWWVWGLVALGAFTLLFGLTIVYQALFEAWEQWRDG